MKNTGSETPAVATTRQAWSIQEPCLHRRQNAERHGDQHGQDQAEQRQFGRGRQAALDLAHHRLAGGERIAEIAMGEVVDIADELLGQRPVEAERLADFGNRLRRRGGTGEIDRRIAGQHAGQQERDDDDADQGRDHRHQALADRRQHAHSSRCSAASACAQTRRVVHRLAPIAPIAALRGRH